MPETTTDKASNSATNNTGNNQPNNNPKVIFYHILVDLPVSRTFHTEAFVGLVDLGFCLVKDCWSWCSKLHI